MSSRPYRRTDTSCSLDRARPASGRSRQHRRAHHRTPMSAWLTPGAFETRSTILGRGRVLPTVLERREVQCEVTASQPPRPSSRSGSEKEDGSLFPAMQWTRLRQRKEAVESRGLQAAGLGTVINEEVGDVRGGHDVGKCIPVCGRHRPRPTHAELLIGG